MSETDPSILPPEGEHGQEVGRDEFLGHITDQPEEQPAAEKKPTKDEALAQIQARGPQQERLVKMYRLLYIEKMTTNNIANIFNEGVTNPKERILGGEVLPAVLRVEELIHEINPDIVGPLLAAKNEKVTRDNAEKAGWNREAIEKQNRINQAQSERTQNTPPKPAAPAQKARQPEANNPQKLTQDLIDKGWPRQKPQEENKKPKSRLGEWWERLKG
jgi:hypothetical protein